MKKYFKVFTVEYIKRRKNTKADELVMAATRKTTLPPDVFFQTEGPEKATRGREGEWEPIKIPRRNLSYIPESTRYPSLLARPRPASYRQANGPRNQLGTAKTRNGASKTSCEIDNKNQLEKQFICSQTFHRITGECELKSTL
jgi:hypothetical protein